MSRSAKAEAALALHRFGMGPRPGSIAAIESDPRGALLAELDRRVRARSGRPLPSSTKAFRTVADANAERQARRIVAARAQKEARAEAERPRWSRASIKPTRTWQPRSPPKPFRTLDGQSI